MRLVTGAPFKRLKVQNLKSLPSSLSGRRTESDVLVRIAAAGVQPLDDALVNGYGSAILDLIREPPFALGQDAVGVVEHVGDDVFDLRVGDRVWLAVNPFASRGTMQTRLWVHQNDVGLAPVSLSDEIAASVPFPAVTAHSGLIKDLPLDGSIASAAVVGAGGAVGRAMIEMLREFVRVPHIEAIGRGSETQIESNLFDVVADCSSAPHVEMEKKWLPTVKPGGYYVTFNGDWMKLAGDHGPLLGSVNAARQLLDQKLVTWTSRGVRYKWGLFKGGSGHFLTEFAKRIDAGDVKFDTDNLKVVDGLESLKERYESQGTFALPGEKVVVKL